jgi:hypothetical protein
LQEKNQQKNRRDIRFSNRNNCQIFLRKSDSSGNAIPKLTSPYLHKTARFLRKNLAVLELALSHLKPNFLETVASKQNRCLKSKSDQVDHSSQEQLNTALQALGGTHNSSRGET